MCLLKIPAHFTKWTKVKSNIIVKRNLSASVSLWRSKCCRTDQDFSHDMYCASARSHSNRRVAKETLYRRKRATKRRIRASGRSNPDATGWRREGLIDSCLSRERTHGYHRSGEVLCTLTEWRVVSLVPSAGHWVILWLESHLGWHGNCCHSSGGLAQSEGYLIEVATSLVFKTQSISGLWEVNWVPRSDLNFKARESTDINQGFIIPIINDRSSLIWRLGGFHSQQLLPIGSFFS